MNDNLGSIEAKKKSGNEHFHFDSKNSSFKVLDFWQWYASDLKSNRLKGILAEFLVAKAMNSTDSVRVEWDAYDVRTHEGLTIEVKAASYVQSWKQTTPSKIRYDIKPTNAWDSKSNDYSVEKKRHADIYVFCLLDHKAQDTLDPLNLLQWTFYVISTDKLNEEVGNQKSIGLTSLKSIGAEEVKYEDLNDSINYAAG